ncbi:MAG: hypothetical protein PF441_00400 [Desulfuromusa sp.]|nr:hypothetical protein [Desulfuromusa sp.]
MGNNKFPYKMKDDFISLLLHLKCGSPLSDEKKIRLIDFIQKHMPEHKKNPICIAWEDYEFACMAMEEGYKTKANRKNESAFFIAAERSQRDVKEKTVEKNYYKIKKHCSKFSEIDVTTHDATMQKIVVPEDYEGMRIYVDGHNMAITSEGVYGYDKENEVTIKIREANKTDQHLLSCFAKRLEEDNDD